MGNTNTIDNTRLLSLSLCLSGVDVDIELEIFPGLALAIITVLVTKCYDVMFVPSISRSVIGVV